MRQRLDLNISDPLRIHKSRRHHYRLDLVWENIPTVAATMCLSDHIVDDLKYFKVDQCLLAHPNDQGGLQPFANEPAGSKLSSLEGSYLHYDKVKRKWIRTGKASGAGEDAYFQGQENTHAKKCQANKSNEGASILPRTSSKEGGQHWWRGRMLRKSGGVLWNGLLAKKRL